MNASPAPFESTILLIGILGTGYCVITPSKKIKILEFNTNVKNIHYNY